MKTLRLTADSGCVLQAAAAGKPRRFRVHPAYGGDKIEGYVAQLSDPIVIDLETLEPRSVRIIANLDHYTERRVGHIEKIENNSRQLSLTGVVFAVTLAA